MTQPAIRRRPGLERVLKTADQLFYEGGIHATGVDLIAAKANVSKATMYTYFPTKDDLVAQYLRGRSQTWQAHVAHELEARGGTATERILTVFDLLGEWFRSEGFRGCPFINAEAESTPDAPGHAVNLSHREWVRGLFAGLLAEAGATAPDMLARQLEMLYDGAMIGAHTEPAAPWAEAARHAALALVHSGPESAGDPSQG